MLAIGTLMALILFASVSGPRRSCRFNPALRIRLFDFMSFSVRPVFPGVSQPEASRLRVAKA